jgi:hypothetical protein
MVNVKPARSVLAGYLHLLLDKSQIVVPGDDDGGERERTRLAMLHAAAGPGLVPCSLPTAIDWPDLCSRTYISSLTRRK